MGKILYAFAVCFLIIFTLSSSPCCAKTNKVFTAGTLLFFGPPAVFLSEIYETDKGDIIIPYFDHANRFDMMAIWSIKYNRLLSRIKPNYNTRSHLENILKSHLTEIKWTPLGPAYSKNEILGPSRLALSDGTYLQETWSTKFGHCYPISADAFEKVTAAGRILLSISLITHSGYGKTFYPNSECFDKKGDRLKAFYARYRSEYVQAFVFINHILFIDQFGNFILTDESMVGPSHGKGLLMIDHNMIENAYLNSKNASGMDHIVFSYLQGK